MFVDSSFLAGLGRGSQAAVAFYEEHAEATFATTTVVAYELFGGLVEQGEPDRLERLHRDLDWVEFEPFTLADALETAILDDELRDDGTPIPVPDAMIAAAARRRDERLVAADGHFERVDGLDYVNFRA